MENLPDVQLRAEREVWDPRARACQAHRHRYLAISSRENWSNRSADSILESVSWMLLKILFRILRLVHLSG
jgi:hypothetical protein